jgi:hypothetical protein
VGSTAGHQAGGPEAAAVRGGALHLITTNGTNTLLIGAWIFWQNLPGLLQTAGLLFSVLRPLTNYSPPQQGATPGQVSPAASAPNGFRKLAARSRPASGLQGKAAGQGVERHDLGPMQGSTRMRHLQSRAGIDQSRSIADTTRYSKTVMLALMGRA